MNEEDEYSESELIPWFPDEIATECLLRIPHRFHSTLKLVSHGWRSLLFRPSFYSQRLLQGTADHLLFLVQPLPSPTPPPTTTDEKCLNGPPAYSLGVFNLTRGEWHRLAMSPAPGDDSEVRIPLFCQVVSLPAAGKLLLLGGWDPDTLEPVSHVYVIDLVAGTWRRAAPMAAPRSFFAVAVAGPETVYVAGGHDGQKNALRSTEVYDVAADEWAALPPMAEERDECLGMAMGGGFLVVSGYGSASQGRFRQDAEWFDPREGRWSKIDGVWPSSSSSPRSSSTTAAVGGGWWRWVADNDDGGEMKEFDWEEMRWKAGRKIGMPPGGGGLMGGSVSVVEVGGGAFMVMGKAVFVVDPVGCVWKQVQTPPHFSGLPFSTSHLLI